MIRQLHQDFWTALALLLLPLLAAAQPYHLPPCYHTRAGLDSFIFALQDSFPHLVKVDSIGHSRGDMLQAVYPVYAVKISDNVQEFEDEPTSLIISHIHAEEVIGMELGVRYMRLLTHQYNRYRNLVNNTQIYFIPTMNPDGLEVIARGLDDYWRKNGYVPPELHGRECTIVRGPGEDSCGVDLNRNFDFNWIFGDTLWYRGSFEPFDYFRGPAPFSEPEARAVRDFARRIKPTLSVVYHSSRQGGVAEQVICPWEFTWNRTTSKFAPDCTAIAAIGRPYASLVRKTGSASGYDFVWSLSHNGNLHDWFYKELGTFQLLTELGPPFNIQPQCVLLDSLNRSNVTGLDWLNRRLINLTGDGPNGPTPLAIYTKDAQTGQAISAEWRLMNTWNPVLGPWYTNEEFGRATCLPRPGQVTIMARKEGYQTATLTTSVSPGQSTQSVTLFLQPLPRHTLTLRLRDEADNPLSGRVYLDGDFPRWVTVAGGETHVSLPSGIYHARAVADESGRLAIWRSFWLGENLVHEFALARTSLLWSEDFASGLDDWTAGGDSARWRLDYDTTAMNLGWSLYTNAASGPRWPVVYPDNANMWLEYAHPLTLDDDTLNTIFLHFLRRGRTDFPADSFLVEISADNGSTWEFAGGFSENEIPWTESWVNLSAWRGQDVRLRFRFKSDYARGDLGLHVDNVRLYGGIDVTTPERPVGAAYSYRITGAYPNPFNPSTTLTYEVAAPGPASIVIYNLLGMEVRRFEITAAGAGAHKLVWDGTATGGAAVTTGLYFARLHGGGSLSTHKLLLLR